MTRTRRCKTVRMLGYEELHQQNWPIGYRGYRGYQRFQQVPAGSSRGTCVFYRVNVLKISAVTCNLRASFADVPFEEPRRVRRLTTRKALGSSETTVSQGVLLAGGGLKFVHRVHSADLGSESIMLVRNRSRSPGRNVSDLFTVSVSCLLHRPSALCRRDITPRPQART